MRYQLSEIRLTPEEYMDEAGREKYLREKIIKKTGLRGDKATAIGDITILRESVDARKKPDVRAVFTVAFTFPGKLHLKEASDESGWSADELPAWRSERKRPVIAGFGPCGMFAAMVLALAGARPLVIERGAPVDERIRDVETFWEKGILDPESNVQYGEGGAGTFSDGKLTTGVRDRRIKWILSEFVEAGADPAILYKSKPHIGTDRLREIVPNIRQKIESLGGQIRFHTRLDGIKKKEGRLEGIYVSSGIKGKGCGERTEEFIGTDRLILATGHSAEDTFRMLLEEGLAMRPKPFSIGVRVEHLQKKIDEAQYGDPKLAKVFGPAEYKISHRCENGRGVYTFCMCPGGRVINAASQEGYALTNGMSDQARDGEFANSGLLVDVRTGDFEREDDPLAGIAFQKKYEKLAWESGLPVSSYGRFREDSDDPVKMCLPEFAVEGIIEAMPHLGRKLKGFDAEDTRMTACETRSSSPVRIERDSRMQSSVEGIIPAGEGPGYAGGIVSAALDGMRAAQAVLEEV